MGADAGIPGVAGGEFAGAAGDGVTGAAGDVGIEPTVAFDGAGASDDHGDVAAGFLAEAGDAEFAAVGAGLGGAGIDGFPVALEEVDLVVGFPVGKVGAALAAGGNENRLVAGVRVLSGAGNGVEEDTVGLGAFVGEAFLAAEAFPFGEGGGGFEALGGVDGVLEGLRVASEDFAFFGFKEGSGFGGWGGGRGLGG